jgi:hypothetical protein
MHACHTQEVGIWIWKKLDWCSAFSASEEWFSCLSLVWSYNVSKPLGKRWILPLVANAQINQWVANVHNRYQRSISCGSTEMLEATCISTATMALRKPCAVSGQRAAHNGNGEGAACGRWMHWHSEQVRLAALSQSSYILHFLRLFRYCSSVQ